jgi:hypothetical protein
MAVFIDEENCCRSDRNRHTWPPQPHVGAILVAETAPCWGGRYFALFGMLDYRAHKLYSLLCLPLRLVSLICFLVIVLIAVIVANGTAFNVVGKIAIGIVVFEAVGGVAMLVLHATSMAFRAVFFWLIDVIPAHGSNVQEARAIVLLGRLAELDQKLSTEIDQCTSKDTLELLSLLNWRERLFFSPKQQRLENFVAELKRIYSESGRQPASFDAWTLRKMRERLPYGKESWFEQAICSSAVFNSLLAASMIAMAVIYTAPT